MSSSSSNLKSLGVVIILALFSPLMILPPKTDAKGAGLKQSETVLGSKPPQCKNKCFSCRPCKAILVVSKQDTSVVVRNGGGDEAENYYLVSWKCECGNKLFHP